MPTSTEYFLDATNLSLATCVFTDIALTTVAPQGYYSDGAIVRYLTVQGVAPNQYGTLSGALSAFGAGPIECETCITPCNDLDASKAIRIKVDAAYPPTAPLGTDLHGTYKIPIDLGSGTGTTGAVIVRVYFRNEYGAGCGLLLDNEDEFGNITISTNNFSASGSTPSVAPTPPDGFPYLGAPDGGYQRSLTYQPDGTLNYGGDPSGGLAGYPLTDDTKFLYVGGAGRFQGGPPATSFGGIYYNPFPPTNCAAPPTWLQVPNNKPNYYEYDAVNCPDCPGGPPTTVPAPSIPFIANPSITHAPPGGIPTWTWSTNLGPQYEWVAGPADASVTVSRDQVQLSTLTQNTHYYNTEGGYRGWYTAVLPKSDPSMTRAVMKLQILACNAESPGLPISDNGLDIVINTNCPKKLSRISYPILGAQPQYMCSEPYPTQLQAFTSGDMSNEVFHVPGAQGVSPNFPQYAPLTEYTEGVPNRWDLVFKDENGEQPLYGDNSNPSTPYWCRYIDANGDPKLFEITHGIITQTNVSYVPEPAACGDIIQTDSSIAGGGIYRLQASLGVATGAVIVRVFTGQNPKGLFVKLLNTDGTVVTKSNSFSIRGSENASGDLSDTQYAYNSMSTINNNNSGASSGGSGYNLSGSNGIYIEETTIYEAGVGLPGTPTRTTCYLDPTVCDSSSLGQTTVYGQDPNSYDQYGSPYSDSGEELYLFDLPVYIGGMNTNNNPTSAIPCVVEAGGVISTFCDIGFAPEGIANGIYNPLGNINLPGNGFTYVGPAAPDEDLFNLCPIEIWMGGTGDTSYNLWTYPATTTACNQTCTYPIWLYDGSGGLYIQTSIYHQIGISTPQVQLYGTDNVNDLYDSPGWVMCVINKADAVEQRLNLEVTSITSNTEFTAKVECPQLLPQIANLLVYKASTLNGADANSISSMCASGPPATNPGEPCYIAHNAFGGDNDDGLTTSAPCVPGVAGGTNTCSNAGTLDGDIPYLNDMVFKDDSAATQLDSGYYYYTMPITLTPMWMYVDEFGIVTCIKDCSELVAC